MAWLNCQVLVEKKLMQSAVSSLESWFKKVARPLPWRKTKDPYAIWVSEIMLQQTQVQAVIPYYERFLSALPTIEALAKAAEPQVLHLWSGLGYYSRARNLQKGARYIVEELKSKFPTTRDEILKVPGIGPYTAGAILSIAFDKKVPLVDGNVMRVFARFFGIESPIEEKATQTLFWKYAEEWVNASKSPCVLNQALMELGATVCTKSSPKCSLCPLSVSCVALKKQWTDRLPLRNPRKKPVDLFWVKILYEKNKSIYMVQNQKGEWWESLWDFPKQEFKNYKEVEAALEKLKVKHGHESVQLLNSQKHTVTHHRLHVFPVVLKEKKIRSTPDGKYVPVADVQVLPLSALAKKIINSLHHN